jgi:hypothetical protein
VAEPAEPSRGCHARTVRGGPAWATTPTG